MTRTTKGRRGWADYALLLRAVIDAPAMCDDLAMRFGENRAPMLCVLANLARHGLILPVATRPIGGGPLWEFVWGFNGPPLPLVAEPPQEDSPTVASFARILNVLQDIGGTIPEVAELAGVSEGRLRPLIGALHTLRLVFIERWTPHLHGGALSANYFFGVDMEDKARPRRISKRQESARRREVIARRQQQAQLIFMTAGRSHPSLQDDTNPN